MKDKVRADELERQDRERANLAEALIMRGESFDEEWAHKKKLMKQAHEAQGEGPRRRERFVGAGVCGSRRP